MSLISYTHDQNSIILRVKIIDSSVSTGAGKTGLTSASSGLIISTIADNEASATAYTVTGSTIETITTLGTYAAPTATKCRFKEVDATNHKGVYEIQIADARFAVASAKYIIVSISGATDSAEVDVIIPLTQVDPYFASAANFRATYDGTGYADDQAPATQSQLGSISNVGSAVHKPAESYTLTTGTQSANTVSDTEALNGVRHTHTDTAGVMELYYEFSIGSGTPSSVQITGYVTGINDDLDVYGYDWVSAGWKQIGNISGSNSTTDSVNSFDLFVDMVGSGVDEGKVRVRFYKASGLTTATLAIDQVFVAFSVGQEGYENASVWYDDSVTNTGTEVGIDGTSRNAVSTEAAVETLLGTTNLHRVSIAPGSAYTLASNHDNRLVFGHGATIALGGQSCDDTHFFDGMISGIATAATGEMEFHNSEIGTASNQGAHYYGCTFDGTVTWTLAGDYHVINCQSGVAGSGSPTFTKTPGQAVTVEFRRWSGGLTFANIQAGDTYTISGELGTVDLGSPSGAVVEIRGTYKAIINIGSANINTSGAIRGGAGEYVNGVVCDTNNGEAGTVDYYNGLETRPSLTWADAQTIATSLGTQDFHIINGSAIVLDASMDNHTLFGDHWTLDLSNEAGSGIVIRGATVSGVGTSSSDEMLFEDCKFGTASIQRGNLKRCGLTATLTMTLAASYHFHSCHSTGVTAPILAKTAGQVVVAEIQEYSGDLSVTGIQASDTYLLHGSFGVLTLAGTGGTVTVIGSYDSISSGGFSGTLNTTGAIQSSDIAAVLVDTGTTIPALIGTPAADLAADIAALQDISTADVLAQVNTALDTAIAELGVGVPSATPSLRDAAMLVYMALRNKVDVATNGTDTMEIHNDAGTKIAEKLLTDSAGDYSEAKMS